jgi:hypothetical protein
MFYDPLKALVDGQGGKKVLKSFAKRTGYLIKITIITVLDTLTKIIGSVMKILTIITLHS